MPAVVQFGHDRWAIENRSFNKLVTRWHASHVYRHGPTALPAITLPAMQSPSVLLAFHRRNPQPAARQVVSRLHLARQVAAELDATPLAAAPRPHVRRPRHAFTNLHKPQFDRKPLAHLTLPRNLANRRPCGRIVDTLTTRS